MSFKDFGRAIYDHIQMMTSSNNPVFEVDVDKDELYDKYLSSFAPGTNEFYRKRTEHDCSECRRFIKNVGAVVSIDAESGHIESIWDVYVDDPVYQPVAVAMNSYIMSKLIENGIKDVYISDCKRIGNKTTRELIRNDDESWHDVKVWHHFYADVSDAYFMERSRIPEQKSIYRDRAMVFMRSLQEISLDATDTVLELINDGSLYKGDEWKNILLEFRKQQEKVSELNYRLDFYCWSQVWNIGDVIGKIKNHSIGTLLVDITNGVDLDRAVAAYESKVTPSNYKRPKAIFTKKMVEDAQKTVAELGYIDSLQRRFATLDDVSVNNVLFANADAANRMLNGADLFESLKKDAAVNPKHFNRVTEVSIDDFVNNILPGSTSVEVLFEKKHARNLMSMIAPVNMSAPSMFKWNNGFSWSYNGNISDSDVKRNVVAAGGDVNGDLRFSLQWNDKPGVYDENDLDAHCKEPGAYRIYFPNKTMLSPNGGVLDIDVVRPKINEPAVENIIYKNKMNMTPGKYLFGVGVFSYRGLQCTQHGFKAEIEIEGVVYTYIVPRLTAVDSWYPIAEISVDRGRNLKIEHLMTPTETPLSSIPIWGINTNTFVPVTSIMYSPNYWGENNTGNKHVFFFLSSCKNPDQPNAWYNEFLKQELVGNHKRVFEALGSKAKVEMSDDQLSGLGFSSTQRNDVVVRVTGKTKRVMRIKF